MSYAIRRGGNMAKGTLISHENILLEYKIENTSIKICDNAQICDDEIGDILKKCADIAYSRCT